MRMLALSLLFATFLPGQDPDPAASGDPARRPTAAEAPRPDAPRLLAEGHLAGPAAFRSAFLPTNLGVMLASDEGEALRRQLQGFVSDALAPWLSEEEAASFDRWDGAAHFQWIGTAGENTVRTAVLVRFSPGRMKAEPFAALVGALDRASREATTNAWQAPWGEPEPLDPDHPGAEGDEPLRVSRQGHAIQIHPFACGDDLGMVFAERWEPAARMDLVARVRASPVPARDAPVRIRLHADQMAALASEGRDAGDMEHWFDTVLGIATLRHFEMSVAPAGPHTQIEIQVQWTGDEGRGMFEGMFPHSAGIPSLIAAVPEDVPSWKVGRFDLGAMLEPVAEAISVELGGGDTGRKVVEAQLGFDLFGDILDHLDGEALILSRGMPDLDSDWAFVDGACLALGIGDSAAFHENWKVRGADAVAVLAGRNSEGTEILGTTIYEVNGPMFFVGSFAVAATPDAFLIGFGDDGVALCRDMIRTLHALPEGWRKAAAAGDRALPEAFAGRRRHAAPGVNGIAHMEAFTAFRSILGPTLHLAAELSGVGNESAFEFDAAQQEALQPLLEANHLERLMSFTSFSQHRWTVRYLW